MTLLTCDRVRELLDYDPLTGVVRWRPRAVTDFEPVGKRSAAWIAKWWNRRFAGTIAGSKHDEHGYLSVRIEGETYLLHRVIVLWWYGKWPEHDVDHKDGDPSNNRLLNLVPCSRAANMKNQRRYRRNTSGHTGVHWHRHKRKWIAAIGVAGKNVHLGAFDKKDDAIAARAQAAIQHGFSVRHGEAERSGRSETRCMG